MTHLFTALVMLLVPVSAAIAQPAGQPASAAQSSAAADTPSTYDKIWARVTNWYSDSSNPVVQRVLFTGRFQHEFNTISADQGDHDEWNTRRFRVGPRITLFKTFTLHAEAELNPQEIDPLYVRLTDAYVQWNKSAAFALTVGKHGILYTMDGATSSKELLTIDRSNLTNNIWFPQEYLPGVSVSGRVAPWTYRVGMYSAGEATPEFGKFDGGMATLAALGYDFAKRLSVAQAVLSANYVHQNEDHDNTFTRQLENILSVNFRLETGDWGLRADVSTATGYLTQSDLFGIMAMPYYNVSDTLQVVGRYTFLESATPNGVRLGTYENAVVPGRGDEFNELYLGANYFFYGHKLKLQSGLQFADLNDAADDGGAYSGVSWTSGLRIGW